MVEFTTAYTSWAREGTFAAYRTLKPDADEAQLKQVRSYLWAAEHPDIDMHEVRNRNMDLKRAKLSHALFEVLTFDWKPHQMHLPRYERQYDLALKALDQAKVSRSLEFAYSLALGDCRSLQRDPAKKLEARADFERAIATLSIILQEREVPLVFQRFLYKRIRDRLETHLPAEYGDRLITALEAEGTKNPWLTEALLGAWHVHAAWIARTNKVASKVTPEGWAGFERHLKAAYAHYKRAHELHPELPEAATGIIAIAMGGHTPRGEDERFWFDRAVGASFDWIPAYDAYKYSLQPKWGGSEEQLLEFGRECAKTQRFETDVPFQYFTAAFDVEANRKDGTVWHEEYDGLRAMLLGYVALNGSPYSKTRLIALGWRTGHWEHAAEALASIKPDAILNDLFEDITGPGVTPAKVLADVRAYTGPGGAQLAQAVDLLSKEKYQECLAASTECLRLADADSAEALARAKDLLLPVVQKAEFMLGDQVRLQLEPGFPGYDFTPEDGRAGWVTKGPSDLLATEVALMATRARFGSKYVVHADLTVVPGKAGRRSWAQVVLDRRPPVGVDTYECGVGVYESNGEVHARTTGRVAVTELLDPDDGPYKLRVSMWNEHWVVELNGRVIVKGAGTTSVRRHPEGDQVAFRATEGCAIENIRIQRLTVRPGELTAAADGIDDPVDLDEVAPADSDSEPLKRRL